MNKLCPATVYGAPSDGNHPNGLDHYWSSALEFCPLNLEVKVGNAAGAIVVYTRLVGGVSLTLRQAGSSGDSQRALERGAIFVRPDDVGVVAADSEPRVRRAGIAANHNVLDPAR